MEETNARIKKYVDENQAIITRNNDYKNKTLLQVNSQLELEKMKYNERLKTLNEADKKLAAANEEKRLLKIDQLQAVGNEVNIRKRQAAIQEIEKDAKRKIKKAKSGQKQQQAPVQPPPSQLQQQIPLLSLPRRSAFQKENKE